MLRLAVVEQASDAVQVYVGVQKPVHGVRQERQRIGAVGISVYQFAQFVAVVYGFRQECRSDAACYRRDFCNGEQNRHYPAAHARHAYIPLHQRLCHVGYQAAHTEWQKGVAQIIYEPEHACGHYGREADADSAVERENFLCRHKKKCFACDE